MRKATLLIITTLSLIITIPSSSAQKQNLPSAAGREASEDDVVRVNITLVTVPVSVKDRGGKLIPNLRREDFHLYEDGVEQEIAYFEPPDGSDVARSDGARPEPRGRPVTVALLLDVSDSTQFKLQQIQDAANAFIDLLHRDDRVMVIAFDKRVQVLTEATSDRGALHEAVSRARTGGGTSLYSALDAVLNYRLNRIAGRKAIVLLTDGVDTASLGATYESTVRAAEESDAVIYPVQYNTYGDFADNPSRQTYSADGFSITAHMTKNGEPASEAYKRATLYLRLLVQKTGGHFQYCDNAKNLSLSFARIASDLRQQYTLGYYPKNRTTNGLKRQIKVKVGLPKVTVNARESYVYRTPAGAVNNQ